MTIASSPKIGWAVASLSAGLVAFWLVLGGAGDVGHQGLRYFIESAYANIVFALAFPVVGALIMSRMPGHPLGWLYCLAGLASSLTLVAYSYAERGLVDHSQALPGALAAGWLSSWIWMCGFSVLLTFGVMLFPDGRVPSSRWRPLSVFAGATLGVGIVTIALRPGPLENHPHRNNPIGLPLPRSWFDTFGTAGWLAALLLAVLGSFAALAVRYRHGSGENRDRMRWFLVAVGLIMVAIAIPANSPVGFVGSLLSLLALPLLPLSVAIAVLRHRLGDIRTAVRRSLVYGWLLAGGLALYAATVLSLDTLLRGHAQPVVALVGAGAVAVAYQPLRQRLIHATDRMLYGERGDPYAALRSLGERLEAAGTAEESLPAAVTAIAAALRLPYVAIELPGDPRELPTACRGSKRFAAVVSIPLVHGGDPVGRLVVGQRDEHEELTTDELRLLDDLARHVSMAAHAVLLDRALRRSHERLVVAREEERKRLRRDLHDGLGPALAGIALGLDAARNIVGTGDPPTDDLLRDLRDETLSCVTEVRRIVDDLRPPILHELGLLAALTTFADRLSSRDDRLVVAVWSPDPLPELPPAVEVAAYRIATEAVTNVARHARARTCVIRLQAADVLRLEVRDDGIGIGSRRGQGVGLSSMAQRANELGGQCTVDRAGDGGTRVRACLPLAIR